MNNTTEDGFDWQWCQSILIKPLTDSAPWYLRTLGLLEKNGVVLKNEESIFYCYWQIKVMEVRKLISRSTRNNAVARRFSAFIPLQWYERHVRKSSMTLG